MNTKYISSKKCVVDLDSTENISAVLSGTFYLNTSGDADDAENLERLLAFKEQAQIVVSTECTVISVDEDAEVEVGDVITVLESEAGISLYCDDNWITLDVVDANNNIREYVYSDLVDQLEQSA